MKTKPFLAALFLAVTLSHFANAGTGAEGGGGGNSINGKLVESFVRDITQTKAFAEKVSPLLDSLDKKVPKIVKFYRDVLGRIDWYFIPGNLKTQSESATGLPFPSDQVAVQRAREVWIDEDLYNALSIDDQAKLILHEMLLEMLQVSGFANRFGMHETMKIVRSSTNLFYNSQNLNSTEIANKLRLIGWNNWTYECSFDETIKCP